MTMITRSGPMALALCVLTTNASWASQSNAPLPPGAERIETEVHLRVWYGVVVRFHADSNAWPKTLSAACDASGSEECELIETTEPPIDFWGSPVAYSRRADGFELRSAGPDRKAGTSDDIVIAHPLDRIIARQLAGCYRPIEGWWTSSPSVVRLDTLPGAFFWQNGSYSLGIDLSPQSDPTGWFPVGSDSVVLQWAQGPQVHIMRLKGLGDTLRRRASLGDEEWSAVVTLVRTTCEE